MALAPNNASAVSAPPPSAEEIRAFLAADRSPQKSSEPTREEIAAFLAPAQPQDQQDERDREDMTQRVSDQSSQPMPVVQTPTGTWVKVGNPQPSNAGAFARDSLNRGIGVTDAERAKYEKDKPLINLPIPDAQMTQTLGDAIDATSPLTPSGAGRVGVNVYKGIAPSISGLTSPEMAAITVATGGIAAEAKAGSVLAKLAMNGIEAYFAAEGSKALGSAAGNAVNVSQDPKSTLDDKIKAWAEVAPPAAITALTGSALRSAPGHVVEAGGAALNKFAPLDKPAPAMPEPAQAPAALPEPAPKGPSIVTTIDSIDGTNKNPAQVNAAVNSAIVAPQPESMPEPAAQAASPTSLSEAPVTTGQSAETSATQEAAYRHDVEVAGGSREHIKNLVESTGLSRDDVVDGLQEATIGRMQAFKNNLSNGDVVEITKNGISIENGKQVPVQTTTRWTVKTDSDGRMYADDGTHELGLEATSGLHLFGAELNGAVQAGKIMDAPTVRVIKKGSALQPTPSHVQPQPVNPAGTAPSLETGNEAPPTADTRTGRTVQGEPVTPKEVSAMTPNEFSDYVRSSEEAGGNVTEEAQAHGLAIHGDAKAIADLTKMYQQSIADVKQAFSDAQQAPADMRDKLTQDAAVVGNKSQFFSEALAAAKSGRDNAFVGEDGQLIKSGAEADKGQNFIDSFTGGDKPATVTRMAEGEHEVKMGDVTITLKADSENPGAVSVQAIRSADKGKGKASTALKDLAAEADKQGITLQASINPFGPSPRMSAPQLEAWYERNGFKSDGYGTIYRTPKSNAGEVSPSVPVRASESPTQASQPVAGAPGAIPQVGPQASLPTPVADTKLSAALGDSGTAPTQSVSPKPVLPKDLAGAQPRYAYGAKQFKLTFKSDLDKALYIVAQKTKSKADAAYLKFAMDHTGLDEAGTRAAGQQVRDRIKAQAKAADAGATLTVKTKSNAIPKQSPESLPVPAQAEGSPAIRSIRPAGVEAARAREATTSGSEAPSAGTPPPNAEGIGGKPPVPPKGAPAMPEPDPTPNRDSQTPDSAALPVPADTTRLHFSDTAVVRDIVPEGSTEAVKAPPSDKPYTEADTHEEAVAGLKKAVAKALTSPSVDVSSRPIVSAIINDTAGGIEGIKDLPKNVVTSMTDAVNFETALGKKILADRLATRRAQEGNLMEQMTEEGAKSNPISSPGARISPGERLSPTDAMWRALGKIKDKVVENATKANIYARSRDVMLNTLDGYQNDRGFLQRTFGGDIDRNYNAKLILEKQLRQPLEQFLKTNRNLDNVSMERISIYALARQGLAERAIKSGAKAETVMPGERIGPQELLKLTPDEQAYYDKARVVLDDIGARLKETARNELNADFTFVKDYWPLQRDWSLYDKAPEPVDLKLGTGDDIDQQGLKSFSDILGQFFPKNGGPTKGMLTDRLPGAETPVKLNAAENMDQAIRNSAQLITHLHDHLKWNKIISSPEFAKQYGNLGRDYAANLLDSSSRAAQPYGSGGSKFVDWLIKNNSVAVMGLRFSQIKHATNLAMAAKEIPINDLMYGIREASVPGSEGRRFLAANRPEIANRFGGEEAIKDLLEYGKKFSSGNAATRTARQLQSASVFPERVLDSTIATASWLGAYRRALTERGIDPTNMLREPIHESAAHAADIKSRKVVYSPLVHNAPQFISRNAGISMNNSTLRKAIFNFQGTMLNQYSNIQQGFIGEGLAKGNVVGALATSAVLAAIVTGDLAANHVNKIIKNSVMGNKTSEEDVASEVVTELYRRVPIAGQFYGARSGNTGAPIVDQIVRAKDLANFLLSDKDQYGHHMSEMSRKKFQVELATITASLAGVPAATSIGEGINRRLAAPYGQ